MENLQVCGIIQIRKTGNYRLDSFLEDSLSLSSLYSNYSLKNKFPLLTLLKYLLDSLLIIQGTTKTVTNFLLIATCPITLPNPSRISETNWWPNITPRCKNHLVLKVTLKCWELTLNNLNRLPCGFKERQALPLY